MTQPPHTALIHGTAIAYARRGVLMTGPSGAGKSDLALRLIKEGAALVADDQVRLRAESGQVIAEAVPALFGRLEIRYLGIREVPARPSIPLHLVVELGETPPLERLPDPHTHPLCAIALPAMRLDAREPAAALKVLTALLGTESLF